jgi:hypothetical protein
MSTSWCVAPFAVAAAASAAVGGASATVEPLDDVHCVECASS